MLAWHKRAWSITSLQRPKCVLRFSVVLFGRNRVVSRSFSVETRVLYGADRKDPYCPLALHMFASRLACLSRVTTNVPVTPPLRIVRSGPRWCEHRSSGCLSLLLRHLPVLQASCVSKRCTPPFLSAKKGMSVDKTRRFETAGDLAAILELRLRLWEGNSERNWGISDLARC